MLLSKATSSAFRLYMFYQYVCSWGIEPTTVCAANTMLHHWATGTPCTQCLIGACLARTPASVRCGMEAISRRHCWGTIEPSAHLDCSSGGYGVLRMNETHLSVFHSVSNQKRSRNVSFPRLATLSTHFFFCLEQETLRHSHYMIDCFLCRNGDSASLQSIIIHVFIAAGQNPKGT